MFLVFVRMLRKVVAEEWVILISSCPNIFLMGLERERWNSRETYPSTWPLVCLFGEVGADLQTCHTVCLALRQDVLGS